MGYVAEIFTEERLKRLPGDTAIGHVRYSTAGGSMLCNAQPIVASTSKGPIALAHNGNLVNGAEHPAAAGGGRRDFQHDVGHRGHRPSHRAVEGARISKARSSMRSRRCKGAYSIVLLAPGRVYAARDPYGFRPLVLGRLGESIVVSSETCAFDLIERDDDSRSPRRRSHRHRMRRAACRACVLVHEFTAPREARCIFEHVYFARPDSVIFGNNVAEVRKRFGAQLAREHPVDADVVIPVPDSGVFAALGYAHESRHPVRVRTGAQSLRRPDVHRAEADRSAASA